MQSIITCLIVLLAIVTLTVTQNDGRYRPPSTTPRDRINDGRYRPSNDGRYSGGNDGRYVHTDVKYVHDDRAGGAYKGDLNPYKQDSNRGGGGGGAGGSGGGARSGAKTGSGAGPSASASGSASANTNTGGNAKRPSTVTARPSPNAVTVNVVKNLPKGKGTGEGGNGWKILQHEDKVDEDGYHWLYETENRILAEENGRIENLDGGERGLRSVGFYEYTGDDGLLYRVDYSADDRGFVPQGDHIPTPPPYVAKLVAYLEANAKRKRSINN